MKTNRDLEPEQRLWSEFHRARGRMSIDDAREASRRHFDGHARDLGNLVRHGYIERQGGDYVVTERGWRHIDGTFEDGLADQ